MRYAGLAARPLLPLALLAISAALGLVSVVAGLAGMAFVAWVCAQPRLPQALWLPGSLLAALLLAAHQVPGFSTLALTPAENLGGSMPWQLRFSPDKALVAATLLAWWLTQPGQPWRSAGRSAIAAGVCLLGVPAVAMLSGILGWLPKWPEHFWLWLSLNLAVTCVAEELFFRALLQRELVRRLGVTSGIVLTALLFGAVHLPFSAGFALLATMAGLGYGLVFHFSGERLWTAVALHGAVNTVHILLLTYPI